MSPATRPRRTDGELDKVFSALSDSTRRSILTRLTAGEATVSELAAPFDMSLPAVSKHLTVLEHAGLVHRRRAGRVRHCSLKIDGIEQVSAWLTSCRDYWDATLDSLADFIENEPPVAR